MPYNLPKRSCNDVSKTSPLKVVSPIIKKYDEHRQKWSKLSRNIEKSSKKPSTTEQASISAPKVTNDDFVAFESDSEACKSPEYDFSYNADLPPDEIALPVQEICAIARMVNEELKINQDKSSSVRHPRKRVFSASVLSKKKLQKQGKMVESALELLKPESEAVKNAREEALVANYFHKVNATLSCNEHFNHFCSILEQLETKETTVINAFKELSNLFAPYPDLIEEFIPFLTAEQAMECGVFMEHLMLTKLTDFLALIDAHFAKTPYQIKKIHAAFEKLALEPNVGINKVTSSILPLLKGNSVLTDYFMELLPGARPPKAFFTDFEDLDEEALSDASDDATDSWERIELPSMPDPYGGINCICTCHNSEDEKFKTRAQHCLPCSKKFINGKLFINTGKILRRACLVFKDHDVEYHRQRLMPVATEPRKRKRSNSMGSPTKMSSADELKSDGEDEKTRGRKLKTPKVRTPKSAARRCLYRDLEGKEGECRAAKALKLDDCKKKKYVREKPSTLSFGSSESDKEESVKIKDENSLLSPVLDNKSEDIADITKAEEPNTLDSDNIDPEISCSQSPVETTSGKPESPPVLSISETEPVPPCINPLLTVVDSLCVKGEATDTLEALEQAPEAFPWKLEEDRVILQTLQVETYCEETFVKIAEALPLRSVDDIKKRFQELLTILYKMKSEPCE